MLCLLKIVRLSRSTLDITMMQTTDRYASAGSAEEGEGGSWHLFVIIPVTRPSVSPECQQMLFEYLRPQKWCLLSVMIPLSWLTPPSIIRTLPLLVINDHWISWHSLALGSIFLYSFIFDCNSASSFVLPSSWQLTRVEAEWGYAVWKSTLNSIQLWSYCKIVESPRKYWHSHITQSQCYLSSVTRTARAHPSCHRDSEPHTIKCITNAICVLVYYTISVNALNVLRMNRSVSIFSGVDSAIIQINPNILFQFQR